MYRLLGKAGIALALGAVIAYVNPISAADQNAPPIPPKQAEGPAPEPLSMDELKKHMKPLERANMAAKGTLKNPYTDNPEAIAQGKKLYDKRASIAERDSKRQIERALKDRDR